MNLDLQRLYLIYQSGSNRDGKKNSNLLQLAKSMGNDLSEAEFEALSVQVSEIEQQFSAKNQTKHLQAALWNLPVAAKANREGFFRPVRTKDNQPVFNDPAESHGYAAPPIFQGEAKKLGPDRSSFSGVIKSLMESPSPTAPPSFADMRKNVIQGGKYDGKTAADITKELFASVGTNQTNSPASDRSSKTGGSIMDKVQMALDVVGTLEPTPFADLTNAGISLARAAMDPGKAGQHLKNAAISGIGVIPYLGDVAKLAKGYGKTGKTVGHSIDSFISSKGPKALEDVASFFGGKNYSPGSNGTAGGGSGNDGGSGNGGSSGGGGLTPFGNSPSGSPGTSGGSAFDVGPLFNSLSSILKTTITRFRQLNDWVNKSAEHGRELLETNRKYASYSGEVSMAYLRYDADSERRTMNEADYLGSSASGLAKARSRVEDAESYANKPSQRTANNSQALIAEIQSLLIEARAFFNLRHFIEEKFYEIIDMNKKDDDAPRNPFEFAVRQADVENKNKKPRLPADGDKK